MELEEVEKKEDGAKIEVEMIKEDRMKLEEVERKEDGAKIEVEMKIWK